MPSLVARRKRPWRGRERIRAEECISTIGRVKYGVICCLFTAALAAACTAGARGTATEAFNQACVLRARGEHRQAAVVLERLLPYTRDEEVFRTLGEIYEANLHDYRLASGLYRRYLALFPEGRYTVDFRNRLTYLTEHRGEWKAIARYRTILDTYHMRTRAGNLALMEGLLQEYPDISLTPEMHSWLAWEYHQYGQSRPALAHIKRYIAAFPAGGQSRFDLLGAYQTWSSILAAAHRYGEAGQVLRKALDHGLEPALYETRVAYLRKERRLWIGLLVSMACLVLALAGVAFTRPWRNRDLLRDWPRVALMSAFVWGGVLLPYWIVLWRGYGGYKSFFTLGAIAELDLILIKLLSPLARRIGRPAYLAAAVILTAAGVYLAYYTGDNLSVFYQLPDFTS